MPATDQGLQPDFQAKIDAMIAASHGRLYIESGYRDNALQAQLYAAAVAKYGEAGASKWVAPPGHSNHNRGLAVDLGGDIGLAHQLAPQFGLEFPMSWEPWHIEPVGLRQHGATSPQAYTQGQPGTVNPTADPTIDQQPQTLFARMSSILSGKGVDQMAGTGFTTSNDTGAAPTTSGGASAGAGATNVSDGKGGTVAPGELYKMLLAQGLTPQQAAAGVAIAGRESGYNAAAHNGNRGTGDDSYGLFQINLLNGMHAQYNPQGLSTVDGSVKAFAEMVKADGLQPWGGYRGDAWYKGTNLQGAVDASGGQVTLDQLQGLQ